MSRTAIYTAVFGLFVAVAACTSIKAADLGKPAAAPAAVAPEPVPDQWRSWYVEAGGVAQFMKGGDKNLAGLGGIGYTYHAFGNPFVGGIFARYGFSAEGDSNSAVLTFDQPLTVAVRGGYLVLPSTLLYGLAGYSKSLNGQDFRGPIVGLGAEAPVLGSMRLAVEYSAQFDRDFKATSDVVHNIGVFARIPF